MSPRPRIRPVAVVAVRRHDGAVLVQRGTDTVTGEEFHRLLGGGIDVGELAAEAVVRELDEEIGARLEDVRLLGWLENRFVLHGRPGHEVVAVHAARISQPDLLELDDLGAIPGSTSTVHWVPLEEVLGGRRPLYPPGLADLLRTWAADPG